MFELLIVLIVVILIARMMRGRAPNHRELFVK
jgi:hypothetical protein